MTSITQHFPQLGSPAPVTLDTGGRVRQHQQVFPLFSTEMFCTNILLSLPLQWLTKLSHINLLSTLESLPSNISSQGRTISLSGSHSSGYGEQCCPPVVDPYTLLALIGGIALATFFLQMTIVNIIGRRRRRRRSSDWADWAAAFTGQDPLDEDEPLHGVSYFAQFLSSSQNTSWLETLTENMVSLGTEAWQYQYQGEDADEEEEENSSIPSSLCIQEMWSCLASVVERAIPYLGKPGGISK